MRFDRPVLDSQYECHSEKLSAEPNTAILQIILPYWYDITEIDGIDFTVHYGLLWVSLKSSENHQ